MLGKSRYQVSHSDSEDSESENEMVQSILKKSRSSRPKETADDFDELASPRSEDITLDFLETNDGFDSSSEKGDGDDKGGEGDDLSDSGSEISDWGVRSVSSDDRTDTGDEKSFARSRSSVGSASDVDMDPDEKFVYPGSEDEGDKDQGDDDMDRYVSSEGSFSDGDDDRSDALSVRSYAKDDLDNQLKRFELNRLDFDIATVMLYVNDLAEVIDVPTEQVVYRLARYINSIFPDKYPMGKDIEASHAAIHAFASLLADPDKSELADRVDFVAGKVASATGESEDFGLTYAVPLVLNSLESSHRDVRNLVGKLSKSTDKAELYPLSEEDATELRSKLDSDETGALKTFKGLRTMHPKDNVNPIEFSLSLDNFEAALRSLGSSNLFTVTSSIPIEGENLESLVVDEDSEELDREGSAFRGGEPLALTISEVPYSELTYNHIFVD